MASLISTFFFIEGTECKIEKSKTFIRFFAKQNPDSWASKLCKQIYQLFLPKLHKINQINIIDKSYSI